MAEVTLVIGAAAVCRDGFPGELKSLVLDPRTRTVTHLVIEPGRGRGTAQGLARLVPLEAADAAAEPIGLGFTEAEFKDLPPAEETLAEFVPGYEVPVQLLPAGQGWRGAGGPVADGSTIPQIREMAASPWSRRPRTGRPRSRRARAIMSARPTATLASSTRCASRRPAVRCGRSCFRKHPWGHAEIAIPISAVSGFDAGVQLSITKGQVKDLAS